LTHIHDEHSLSCVGTDTSIQSGGFKVVLWDQTNEDVANNFTTRITLYSS